MKIDQLQSYAEVITGLRKKSRRKHLLFGNGFSMAYDSGIFSYNALATFIERIDDDLLKQLFNSLNTKNFELIMQQLDNFCEIAKIFSDDPNLVPRIQAASEKLKSSLITAVQELHPEHVFKVTEEECRTCFAFLNEFLSEGGNVFSTNYDLLPYWVLMRSASHQAIDGFGRVLKNDTGEFMQEEDMEWSDDLIWGKHKDEQTVHYLHGALPIFDTGVHVIKEVYDTQNFLLANIKQRMERKEYPIFITAGSAREKLTHIVHNKYLSFCYDKLSTICGSLVVFGFNFGNYDTHIIDAINAAAKFRIGKDGKKDKLYSVYIGVYSDDALEHIESIRGKFHCKVNLYDARTAALWRS